MQRAADETGATAVEYGLFMALVAAVILIIVALLGSQILALFQTVEGQF